MKKVIVVTMVLAATAFSAELNIEVQGPSELGQGETGTIDFVFLGDSGATERLLNGTMLVKVETTGADLEITDVYMNPDLIDITSASDPVTLSSADGYIAGFFNVPPFSPVTEDMVVLSFDVLSHGCAGTITVGLYDHNDESSHPHFPKETQFNNDSGVFTGSTTPLSILVLTPEPASLALLAIGGLAVLRRR